MKTPEEIINMHAGSVVFARFAEEFLSKGNEEEAIKVLENGLEVNPYYGPGYSLLAEIHSRKNNIEEAISNYEKALTFQRSPSDMVKLAEIISESDPFRAKSLLIIANIFEPDNFRVIYLIENIELRNSVPVHGLTPFSASGENEIQVSETSPEEDVKIEEALYSSNSATQNVTDDSSKYESIPEDGEITDISDSVSPTDNVIEQTDISTEVNTAETFPEEFTTVSEIETDEEPYSLKKDSVEQDSDNFINNIETDLPGYSEILRETEALLKDETKSQDIPELKDEDSFDISVLNFDISNEEPILTEEEKAELLSLSKDDDVNETESKIFEDNLTFTSESDMDDDGKITDADGKSIFDNIFRLSEDELHELNEIKTEIDITDSCLETETVEGIDYSDILYGEEKNIGNQNLDDKILNEIFRNSGTDEEINENTESLINIEFPENDTEISGYASEEENRVIAFDIEKKLADELGFDKPELLEKEESMESQPMEDVNLDNISIDIIGSMVITEVESENEIESDKNITNVTDNLKYKNVEDTAESLDSLYNEYLVLLKETPDTTSHVINKDVSEPESKSVKSQESDKTIKAVLSNEKKITEALTNEEDTEFGEATATMAEIFVSQGLLNRAVEIYKVLHHKNPSNEKIIARLKNLQLKLEEQN